MFSMHTAPKELNNATIVVFFFEGGGEQGNLMIFLSTRKRKAGDFKFLRFEGCFRKAPFW